MTVAVCSLGCDRKASEGFPSWPYLFQLQGDYSLYFNYESTMGEFEDGTDARLLVVDYSQIYPNVAANFDKWAWKSFQGTWRKLPQFDQDQARLASIVTARNMCIEYAMQTDASHLLFVDADIIPPLDIIPRLLEVNEDAVAGLVYGRGIHKDCPYVFGEKQTFQLTDPQGKSFTVKEAEHANIGFTLISRRLFEATRFRWGTSHYPDGRVSMTSDDPAFHLDSFIKFGKWMFIRMDVVGQHIGDLKANETSQF